jgi:hypothetical protein
MQAYGHYQQGKAEAGMMKQNARLADQQAKDATALGAIQEERVRQNARQAAGAQRAALGANGLDVGTGTALQLQTDTAGMGEKDAYLARANALREAWGFKVEASNYRNQANITRKGANAQAFGTVLGSGANAFGSYRSWTNNSKPTT